MTFSAAVEAIIHLGVCTIDTNIFGAPERQIDEVRFLGSSKPDFRPNVLYIGPPKLVPDDPASDSCVNLVCCGGSVAPVRALGTKALNYLHVMNGDAGPLIYNKLRLALGPRGTLETENMQKLTDALLSGQGLQHMADLATEVFGNPVRISDVDYNYLVTLNMQSSQDPILQEFIDGRPTDEHVGFGSSHHIRERLRKIRYPILSPVPAAKPGEIVLGTGILSAATQVQGVTLAYCSLYDAWRPHSPEDYELLDYFSKLVSLELQKDSYYLENKGMRYSYFLHDLLTNRLPNIKNVRERLRTIGWSPKNDLYVLSVDLRNIESRSITPSRIAEQLRTVVGDGIYVIFDGVIVLLFSCNTDCSVDFDKLRRFLTDINLRAGLSGCFADILEVPKHYKTSLSAVKLGARLAPGQALLRFPDYVIFQLFEGQEARLLLDSLAYGAIPKLLAYDKAHQSPLLLTLRAYLDTGLSSSAAAKELGIHKNTFLYRLEKIRDITGLTLRAGDELLPLQLAIKLLDYMDAK